MPTLNFLTPHAERMQVGWTIVGHQYFWTRKGYEGYYVIEMELTDGMVIVLEGEKGK